MQVSRSSLAATSSTRCPAATVTLCRNVKAKAAGQYTGKQEIVHAAFAPVAGSLVIQVIDLQQLKYAVYRTRYTAQMSRAQVLRQVAIRARHPLQLR